MLTDNVAQNKVEDMIPPLTSNLMLRLSDIMETKFTKWRADVTAAVKKEVKAEMEAAVEKVCSLLYSIFNDILNRSLKLVYGS